MKNCSSFVSVMIVLLLILSNYSQIFAAGNCNYTLSTNSTSLCAGQANGNVNVNVTGSPDLFTYTWSTGKVHGPTSLQYDNLSGLPAGNYTVTVTDTAGCSVVSSATIIESPQIIVSLPTNVSGCNGTNVTISPMVSGGAGSFYYSWTDMNGKNLGAQKDLMITAMTSQNYIISVTDMNGCAASASTTLNVNSLPIASITKNDASSSISMDGSASVMASGGMPPYNYLWSNNQTMPSISGLGIGYYMVTVKDMNNCMNYASVNINQGQTNCTLSITLDKTDVTLKGGSDGTAKISNVFGAKGFVSYLWSNNFPSPQISGLKAGYYSVTATDSSGCKMVQGVQIYEPTSTCNIYLNSNKGDATAPSYNNGWAKIFVSGMVSYPVTYQWNNGMNKDSIGNLTPGQYNVTVTDMNNCFAQGFIQINQQGTGCDLFNNGFVTINATLMGNPKSYNINANVKAGAMMNDFTGNCNYTWTMGDGNVKYGNMFNYTYPQAGNYNLCVKATENGYDSLCKVSNCFPLNVKDSIVNTCNLGSNFTVTNTSSVGGNDGSATVNAYNGTMPYTYQWSNGANTQTVYNLKAGVYNVTVTDMKGCLSYNMIYVYDNQTNTCNINITYNKKDVTIKNGSNGEIHPQAMNGMPPYNFKWSNGMNQPDISGLMAGIYTLTVTDMNNCSASIPVQVNEVLPVCNIMVNLNAHEVSYKGATDGEIYANAQNAYYPVSYLWNNGAKDQNLINLPAGNYTVTVTDMNGCTAISQGVVNGPQASCNLGVTISGTQVSGNNYNFNAIVTGETNFSVMGWKLGDSVIYQPVVNYTFPSKGKYFVYTKVFKIGDSSCYYTAKKSFNVGGDSTLICNISGTINKSDVTYNGGNNGNAYINNEKGENPITYQWSCGGNTNSVNNLVAGTYTVTMTDAIGCKLIKTFTISQPSAGCTLNANLTFSSTAKTYTFIANINGATTGYNIVFDFGDGTQSPSVSYNTFTHTYLNIGNYNPKAIITSLTDATCFTTAFCQTINVKDSGNTCNLNSNYTVVNASKPGASDGSATINVMNGVMPYTYYWSNGSINQTAYNLSAGNYSVTIKDALGCQVTNMIYIKDNQSTCNINITFNKKDVSFKGGNNGEIHPQAMNGVAPYNFKWSNGMNQPDISGLMAGMYTLTVTDMNNCSASIPVQINEVLPVCNIMLNFNSNEVSHKGAADGSINVNANNANYPVNFQWSNGAKDQNLINLPAGIYTVTATDANGCTAVSQGEVKGPSAACNLNVTIAESLVSGFNYNFNAVVTGETNYTVMGWKLGDSVIYKPIVNYTFPTKGKYLVYTKVFKVGDSSCYYMAQKPISVGGDTNYICTISGTLNKTDVSNYGGNNGNIYINNEKGVYPFKYQWSNGATTNSISMLPAGTYSVTMTDAIGCKFIQSITIVQPSANCTLNGNLSYTSNGKLFTFMVNVNGATAGYNVAFDFGDGSVSPAGNYTTYTHSYLKAGNYYPKAIITSAVDPTCFSNAYCNQITVKDSTSNTCSLNGYFMQYPVGNQNFNFIANINGSPNYIVKWMFGDGSTNYITGTNITYNFKNTGKYLVCMTATDQSVANCSFTKCDTVKVFGSQADSVKAYFMYTVSGNTVTFNNKSTANATSFYWNYGDGMTENIPNPIHVFAKSGFYPVCLGVTSPSGNQNTYCMNIQVGSTTDACLANFDVMVDSASKTITVLNNSQSLAYYNWTFGDGGMSSAMNPVYTYSKSGMYHICLSGKNATGSCQNSFCKDVYIPDNSTNECWADFSYVIDTGLTIKTFAIVPTSNKNLTGFWDFGDGNKGTEPNMVHIYQKPGLYHVCVNIYNKTGAACQVQTCKDIQVGSLNCNADFSYYIDPASQLITFKDQSQGSISKATFDFGDGSQAYNFTPTHTYAKEGIYIVTEQVYSATSGCQSSITKSIQVGSVNNVLQANFTYWVDTTNIAHFNNTSIGNFTASYWSFGDGGFSNDISGVHPYTKAGVYNVCLNVKNSTGTLQNQYCGDIMIGELKKVCKPDFTFFTDSLGKVTFKDASLGSVNKWYWNFGDGSVATGNAPTHQYTAAGVYNVCVSIIDSTSTSTAASNGCFGYLCKPIQIGKVQEICKAGFTFFIDASKQVSFNNTSVGNIAKTMWNFGDGTVAYNNAAIHQYNKPGTYNVCLSVGNATGTCNDQYCAPINIIGTVATVNAKFEFFVDNSNTVHFKDVSSGNIQKWFWYFGNGKFSNLPNPSVQFVNAGVYNVNLTVIDTVNNIQSNVIVPVQIGQSYQICQSDFKFFTDNGGIVHFNQAANGNINKYFWSFGNGKVSNASDPVVQYKQTGIYNVCLTVIDTISNCQNISCKDVYYVGVQPVCNAKFSYMADSTTQTATFFSQSIGNIAAYYWTFGDGSFSYDAAPKHKYSKEGYYFVSLTVKDSTGACQNTISDNVLIIGVKPVCKADFSFFVDNKLKTVNFNSTSTSSAGSIRNYWYFGDGTSSKATNPVHKYAVGGVYTVSLSTYDSVSYCQSFVTKQVFIQDLKELVQADFNYYVDSTNKVQFTDASKGNIKNYYWYLGNGIASGLKNPSQQYPVIGGIFKVCLTVSDSAGTQSNVCKDVQVGSIQELCGTDFNFFVDSLTNNVIFSSNNVGNIIKTYWTFGDGNSSYDANPVHKFVKPGFYDVCITAITAKGCQSKACKQVKVDGLKAVCKAAFNAMVNDTTKTVSLFDMSEGSASKWYWYFGDGTTASDKNPVHTYKAGGVYAVCLTTFDVVSGCQSNICNNVYIKDVKENCVADFTFYLDDKTNTVQFKDQSIGTATSYFWYLGNGITSNVQNPVQQFNVPGIYNVCLNIYNPASGCQAVKCQPIQIGTINQVCQADFNFYVADDNTVTFKDASLGKINKWYWNFDDGTFSSLANPTHNFKASGVYKVHLFTFDTISKTCFADIVKEVYIKAVDVCNANFSYFVDATNNVQFNNLSVGNADNWYWSFGDGGFDKTQNPIHAFKPGFYDVSLYTQNTVTGCKSQFTSKVQIGSIVDICQAKFSYFIDQTNNVALQDLSQGLVQKWFWNFGDGFTSSSPNPVHAYKVPGLYTISLSTYSAGCTGYFEQQLQIGTTLCIADFTSFVDPTTNTVAVTNQSKGNATQYFWDFGDGQNAFTADASHTYANGGLYTICLVAGNLTAKTIDKKCQDVQVGIIGCNAKFVTYVDSITKVAYFKNEVLGSTTKLYWEFGDGASSSDNNPKHQYKTAGFYNVTLNTFDNKSGCMDNAYNMVVIASQGKDCQAEFNYYIDPATNKVYFNNSSIGTNLVNYLWDFGDGITDVGAKPSHGYSAGYYNVCLSAWNADSTCKNTICQKIQVGDLTSQCSANFIYSVDSASSAVVFADQSAGNITNRQWTFGDGGTSVDINPNYTYAKTGYYLATLEVRNPTTGCYASHVEYLNIGKGYNGVKGVFGYAVNDSLKVKGKGIKVDFVGASFGDPAAFAWDFGDGTTNNTTSNPAHTYSLPGTYNVCYTVMDSLTDQGDKYCQTITVLANVTTVKEIMPITIGMSVSPNPFTDNSVVYYNLGTASTVDISLYSSVGEKLATLVNESQSSGSHQVALGGDALSSGVYYVKMIVNNESITKKVILVK